MSGLSDMTAPEVAQWVQAAGRVLVEKDPNLAASTFADLNDAATQAVGGGIVTVRLAEAQAVREAIEFEIKMVAANHFLTVAAITGDSQLDHITQAKAHLAHNLKHKLGLSYPAIGRAMGKHHTTAMRLVRTWDRRLKGATT